jgi:TonB-linked SusC/RagA family outer membrane protein
MKKSKTKLKKHDGCLFHRSMRICFILFSAGFWTMLSAAPVAADIPKSVPGTEEIKQDPVMTATGTITDANGEPLPGVAVMEKGNATNGTMTDVDGKFSLKVSAGATLAISYLGFEKQEVKAGTDLNIILKEEAGMLDEVVVTALGIKKDAKALGYSVSNIKASELVKTGSPNFATALYGKASGVRIQAAPGGGSSAVSINIRGLNSITGNNQPLVIIDGVPMRNGNANADGYWGDQRIQSNGLTDINPEDIENISILKGASASALYGSEAANGVIMITTKSGKRGGGVSIDLNATLSADFVAYMPEMQTIFGPGPQVKSSSYQWDTGGFYMRDVDGQQVKSIYEGYSQFGPKYDGSEVYYWNGKMRKYSPLTSNPWKDIFRTGINQTYNLGISHGSEKSNTRFSYTFMDNRPNQYNSNLDKHSFSLSGSLNVLSNVSISYTANYMRESVKNRPYRISRITNNYTGMPNSFDDMALMRDMTMTSLGYKNVFGVNPTLTPDESFAFRPGSYSAMDEYFWNILGREQLEDNNRLIASVTPNWEIIKGLNLRGRIATDFTSNKIERREMTEKPLALLIGNENPSGSYTLDNRRYEIYYGDILLSYNKRFAEVFDLTANAGWSGRREKTYYATVNTVDGLTVENWFHINASKSRVNASMNNIQLLKTAYFGTLGISYDNYLYLEGTVRQETSSTLAPKNNAFFYPSVNASFIISEALKNKKPQWLDYGKARVSYGIVGNAPDVYFANMAYEQKSLSGLYTYNITPESLGNDKVRPEKKYEWEFGLEGKFFGDRLGFEMTYYTNRVEDQLLQTTTPWTAGGANIFMNVGELQNKGLEFLVYGTPVKTRDFGLTLNANIAVNRNKITKLIDGVDELTHGTYDNVVEIKSRVGEPMGNVYAYVPKTNEKGEKIVGSDGLYQMDFSERKKIGNAMPKVTGGFGISTNWKGIFLDAMFDFRIGGAVLNTPYQYMMGIGNLVESLPYRDAEHGGLSYYFPGNNIANPTMPTGTAGYNGEKIFDNGRILPGVKEDGTPNDIIVPADTYYENTYAWGPYGASDYSNSVFDNSYLKFRELSIGYHLPASIASKFGCKNLSLSAFARNLCYLYKNMPIFDAEATDGTTWGSQTQIGGSTATTRTFGVSLRANF